MPTMGRSQLDWTEFGQPGPDRGKLKYQMLDPSEMDIALGDVHLLPPSMPNIATHLDMSEADRHAVPHLPLSDYEEDEDIMPDQDSFKRAEIRASVFDTYAICSALFAGFSVTQPSFSTTALAVTRTISQKDSWVRITTLHIQQWLLYLCTASAVYACTIFTFCALYSKTALAHPTRGLELLETFLKQTAHFRKYAFYSMYSTSIVFSSSLVWNVFQSFSVKQGMVAVLPLAVVIGFTVLHSSQLLKAASPIFANAAKYEKEKEERAAKAAAKSDMGISDVPNPNEGYS